MVQTKKQYKDILVFYQGGGYDGCIWEWNFFSFDKNGEFFNLYTSGCMGIKDEQTAIEMIGSPDQWEENTSNKVYVYDLTNEEKIDEFQSEHSVPSVVAIVNRLNAGEFGEYSNDLWFKCDCCGEKILLDGVSEGWHGCGGIAITADTKLCSECYFNRSCDYCGDYDENCEEQFGYCSYHFDTVLEKMFQGEFNHVEYDSQENSFYIVPTEDIDADTVKEYLNDGEYWLVVTAEKDHSTYQKYLTVANSEQTALNDVCSGYLDGNYYEVIEIINFDYSKAIDYIDRHGLNL